MKFRNCFIVIFILTSVFANAQSNYQFKTISVPDGLSNVTVLSIFQDSFGYMWFGTQDGLNRYDGITMKTYRSDPNNPNSIVGNLILKVYEDSHGDIWVSTSEALNRFDYATEKFEAFYYDQSRNQQFYNGAIDIYEGSDGKLWVGRAFTGLTYFDREQEKLVLIDSTTGISNGVFAIFSIREDSLGNIWYSQGNNFDSPGTLSKYDPRTGEITSYADSLKVDGNPVQISLRLTRNDQNRIFATSYTGHLFEIHPTSGRIERKLMKPQGVLFDSQMDSDGYIWITTVNRKGLIKYHPETDKLSFIQSDVSSENSLPNEPLISIYISKSGLVWVGMANKGLLKFDPAKRDLNPYRVIDANKPDVNLSVIHMAEDKVANILYLLTQEGLYEFDLKEKVVKRSELNDLVEKYNARIGDLFIDSDRVMWLEVLMRGVVSFDMNKKRTQFYKFASSDPNGFKFNDVRNIHEDNNGDIWFSCDWGVIKFNKGDNEFVEYYPESDTTFSSVLFDLMKSKRNNGNMFAGINRAGNNYDSTRSFKVSSQTTFLVTSTGEAFETGTLKGAWDYGLVTNSAGDTLFLLTQENTLHAGGDGKNKIHAELITLDPGTYYLTYKSDDSHAFNSWNAPAPFDWDAYGIEVFRVDENEISTIQKLLNEKVVRTGIAGQIIEPIYPDSKGRIWIGTQSNGFSIIHSNGDIENISLAEESPVGFNADNVKDFIERNDGKMWITTFAGLVLFDPGTKKKQYLTTSDGLPTNYLMDIVYYEEDNSYWMSSLKGLVKFSAEDLDGNYTFISYDLEDGIQDYTYFLGSALITADGRLAFGGNNGFNLFRPFGSNSIPPNVVINEMKISNQTILPGSDNSPLEKHIQLTDTLSLKYQQNDFSFEFNALHFTRPEKNKFAYYLEGFDEDWIYDNRRFATYTNLDPGKYTFKVKAANSDGVWMKNPKEVHISISPPWWRTIYAYFSYAIIAGVLFITFDRLQKKRIIKQERERQKIQEAELRAKAAEAEARAIAAENERKTKELEEARELQLNLLPDSLPDLPNLDIAVYMKTATEVGGDYYDFSVGMDGTLTAVIGDATGHGLNAGTVVTVTKSLFNTYSDNNDILLTFREISKCLKEMKFKFLVMCLMLLKFRENSLEISSAGMPPALIFRKDKGELEEILVRGMPLGASTTFPYKTVKTNLNSGDIILLMSDGFPELMNEEKKLLGYENVQKQFLKNVNSEPEKIIAALNDYGDKWRGNHEQDDDITFVIIKVK